MMIRKINRDEIQECVTVIRSSFLTVADEFGFTVENAPGFTAFSITEESLSKQMEQEQRGVLASENWAAAFGACLPRGRNERMFCDASWDCRRKYKIAKVV